MFSFFRGNGSGAGTLAERDDTGIIGSALPFCPDAVSLSLSNEYAEHINKCALVDAVDFRIATASKGELTLKFPNAEDKFFAISALGTINVGDTGTVAAEQLPADIPVGFVWNLGGLTPHQNVTNVVFTPAMVEDTDYTLDEVAGTVTFLIDQSSSPTGPSVAYDYSDASSVSIQSAAQKNYFFRFKFINRGNANTPGILELYNIRPDPASLLNFMSEGNVVDSYELKCSVLPDPTKAITDTELGQFGRRINVG